MNVSRKHCSRRGGFTLMEVMLVLVILVVLASLAVVAIGPMREKAFIRSTQAQIGGFVTPLESFSMDVGVYPTTDQGLAALHEAPSDLEDSGAWRGPYLDRKVPKDPWRNEYQYEYAQGDQTYHVWSWGPDRISGNEDDISNLDEE